MSVQYILVKWFMCDYCPEQTVVSNFAGECEIYLPDGWTIHNKSIAGLTKIEYLCSNCTRVMASVSGIK